VRRRQLSPERIVLREIFDESGAKRAKPVTNVTGAYLPKTK